jgi:hypothetical protein
MTDIEFFWPRAWLCLFGLVLTIMLVAVTNKPAPNEKPPAPTPPSWMDSWLVMWRATFGQHITRPGDVTREVHP